jgi:hypothetical protein
MLTKKHLGSAIKKAVQLKKDAGRVKSKAEIARHFGVSPPSLAGWEKEGSIDKDKLGALFDYFSDVVGPEHWELSPSEIVVLHTAVNAPHPRRLVQKVCALAEKIDNDGLKELIVFAECLQKSRPYIPPKKMKKAA